MTITVNRWTAVLAIALMGILAGLALGRVTDANSAPKASASYTAPFERTLKEMARDLHAIKQEVGETSFGPGKTLRELLEGIKSNTFGACDAAGGSPYCHPF